MQSYVCKKMVCFVRNVFFRNNMFVPDTPHDYSKLEMTQSCEVSTRFPHLPNYYIQQFSNGSWCFKYSKKYDETAADARLLPNITNLLIPLHIQQISCKNLIKFQHYIKVSVHERKLPYFLFPMIFHLSITPSFKGKEN